MCLDDLTHSRRDFLKLSAVLSAAGALPLLSSLQARAASEPDAPVRIGYLPITDATPLLVAHNNGRAPAVQWVGGRCGSPAVGF